MQSLTDVRATDSLYNDLVIYNVLDCCDLDLRVVHLAGGQRKSLAHLMLLDGRAAIIAMLSLR